LLSQNYWHTPRPMACRSVLESSSVLWTPTSTHLRKLCLVMRAKPSDGEAGPKFCLSPCPSYTLIRRYMLHLLAQSSTHMWPRKKPQQCVLLASAEGLLLHEIAQNPVGNERGRHPKRSSVHLCTAPHTAKSTLPGTN